MISATSRRRLADAFALEILWERERLQAAAATGGLDLAHFARGMVANYQTADHIARLIEAVTWAATTPDARLIVTMPPRHSKSLHVSENLPAWFLGRWPHKRIILASHTAELAYTFSRRVRNKIADPRWPFPGVAIASDNAAVRAWDLAGGSPLGTGGLYAVGVGGSPAGVGCDLLIVDDPIGNAAEAESSTSRAALWEWWQGTIRHRLEPGGSIIVTSTRWSEDDLTGRLLAAEAAGGEVWRHLHLPALWPDGTALWPARWSVAALEHIRTAIGSRRFESLYQGQPSAAEGSILKRHWWRYWHHPGQPLPPVIVPGPAGDHVTAPCLPLPPTFDASAQSWDMTFKQTTDGSFVVGQVWGMTGADRFLVDQVRARWDFPDAILAVQSLAAKWPHVVTKLIESAANGPAVVAALRHKLPGLVEVAPQGSKEARAHAASAVAESGNVYLPHPALAPWVDGFVEECAAFPFGAHDDQVDAYAQAMARFTATAGAAAYSYDYLSDGEVIGRNGTNGHHHEDEDAFVTMNGRWR